MTFCKRAIGMCVKLLSPRHPRIRKQNIHVVSRLRDSLHESLDIRDFGTVRRHGNGAGAWTFVGKGIERRTGGVAGGGFAGGDVDFGATGLHETGGLRSDVGQGLVN